MGNENTYSIRLQNDSKTKKQVLSMSGELCILNAEAITKKLQGMSFTSDLTIKLSKIESLDLSGLQIIYSLIKTLKEKDLKTNIEAELSERMNKTLKNTGFELIINNTK